MSRITHLRNIIRANMKAESTPFVTHETLYLATEIDADIRAWRPPAQTPELHHRASMLYKQTLWIYLWRTIYPLQGTSWVPNWRIISVVEDGLALLASFPAGDPLQTLLLAPAFVIGCAAFEGPHRVCVRMCISRVRAYTGLRNADLALGVLERVWGYMDARDARSWDWQGVAREMGVDFLVS
jgi:hypothetical protein